MRKKNLLVFVGIKKKSCYAVVFSSCITAIDDNFKEMSFVDMIENSFLICNVETIRDRIYVCLVLPCSLLLKLASGLTFQLSL